jgi:hypothetical protein
VREGAADDHLLTRRAADGELRVARHPARHAHAAADEWLALVMPVDDGDPVAAPQQRPVRRWSTVEAKAARDRRRAQQLPVHVDHVTRVRV